MSDDQSTADRVDDEDVLDEGDVLGKGDLDDELFGEDDDDADGEEQDLFADDEGSSEEADSTETAVPLDASEDGDDELGGEPPVDLAAIEGLDVDDPIEVAEEDDEDPNDTIREGEFVCTSCHMAKRSSALADADEMLCRDCV